MTESNMRTKVKICGVRTIEAAKAVIEAGADFLGFNFVPTSERFIDPQKALKIINSTRGQVKIVGVFQNALIGDVIQIASDLNLDFVQLHGYENNNYIRALKIPVIKSITVDDQPQSIKADYFILDRLQRGEGEMVDLEKGAQLAFKLPLFFAGGLTSDNISEVVTKVRPFAVDVAAGVETDGVQDLEKIRVFVKNAKGVIL